MNRDITYYMYKKAFEEKGCFVCNIMYSYTLQILSTLVGENVNKPFARDRIYDSMGFCNQHAWMLKDLEREEYGDFLGQAIIYAGLIEKMVNDIDEVKTQGMGLEKFRLWKKGLEKDRYISSLTPNAGCQVCDNEKKIGDSYLTYFADNFTENEVLEPYINSEGLCRIHFLQLLSRLDDRNAERMVGIYKGQLSRLQHRLEEYIRKRDYSYRDEPLGEEQNSWTDAVNLVSGVNKTYRKSRKNGLY